MGRRIKLVAAVEVSGFEVAMEVASQVAPLSCALDLAVAMCSRFREAFWRRQERHVERDSRGAVCNCEPGTRSTLQAVSVEMCESKVEEHCQGAKEVELPSSQGVLERLKG